MGLRTRLLVGLAVFIVVAVASSGWVLLTAARVRLETAQETQARLTGEGLARLLRTSYDPALPLGDARNRAQLGATVGALVDRGDASEIVVADAEGRALIGEPGDDWGLRSAAGGTLFIARRAGAIFAFAPLPGARGPLGAARIRLAGSDALDRALDASFKLLGVVLLVDGALAVLLGSLFIRRVIGPLRALEQAARRVAGGALDLPPVPVATHGDELARLTDAFNRMTASLRVGRDQVVAQEKLVTVGRLAAGVAHEVGNPLAAVLGYVDLLLHDEKDADRRDMLTRIRRETDRIRHIVAELLDYSRPVKGDVEPVRLRETVDATASLLRPQARMRGVTVENEVPAGLPPVAASSSRLQQILVNLLLNAADAMNGEGAITVTAQAEDDAVLLRVRDSGPGVPAADRARVFDPFFTTKEPGQGTGLGLSVSRAIAQVWGGDVVLADDDGAGATFVVRLRPWPGRSAG